MRRRVGCCFCFEVYEGPTAKDLMDWMRGHTCPVRDEARKLGEVPVRTRWRRRYDRGPDITVPPAVREHPEGRPTGE